MGRCIGKNTSKNLSSKYSQQFLEHSKKFATDALKTASNRPALKKQKQLAFPLAIKLLIKLHYSLENFTTE